MVFKEAATLPEVVEHVDWRFVLALTHVCRLWHAVVIAESSLWSHIHTQSGTQCVDIFIQRSSGLPLTIYAFLNLNEVALLNKVLYLHGVRARAVHLDHEPGMSGQQSLSVFNKLSWNAPQLESFVLKAFFHPSAEEALDWHVCPEEISPLKALRLHLFWLWDYLPMNLFQNLTHLLLWSASYYGGLSDSLLALLSRAPMLQHLQLVTANVDPASHPSPSLVSLPHTRTVGSSLDFSDPSTFPHPNTLDIPALRLLDSVTSIDLSASSDGFLLAGQNAPHPTAGFFIEVSGCVRPWTWLARLHTMLPFRGNITVLHMNLTDVETAGLILTPMLWHLPRLHELCCLLTCRDTRNAKTNEWTPVKVFLSVLFPSSFRGPGAPCPDLQVLGIEAELAHDDFPFSMVECVAEERGRVGCPISRFVYHPHTRKHDDAGTRALFAASFAPLAALVDVVDYRHAEDARACPFRSPQGGCWDVAEAERYWKLPGRLMSYGRDPDSGCEGLGAGPTEGDSDGDGEETEVSIFATSSLFHEYLGQWLTGIATSTQDGDGRSR
ncbi:hypothetical protein V8D89_005107 [Ganoderma adspersum]